MPLEKAQRLATAWLSGKAANMREAFKLAGLPVKDRRTLHRQRRQAEEVLGIQLPSLTHPGGDSANSKFLWPSRAFQFDEDRIYTAVLSSDHHYMPGVVYPAHQLLCKLLPDIKPDVHVIMGDAFNGGKIGRFDAIGWEKQPDTKDEYEAARLFTDELADASGKALLVWIIGNHDIRLERYLANKASQWEGMPGSSLPDLFPRWQFEWSMVLNQCVMLKHRFHSGMHAAYNNVMRGGVNICTGHTHRLMARPWTDYRGTRYGIECGTIADLKSAAFHYAEDNSLDWQSGFVVITVDGHHMTHELIRVHHEGYCVFRGQRVEI